jgi:hypothetical protein
MAEAHVRTLTLKDFRRMDSLSGEMRVVGGSRHRRGVRRSRRQASDDSQTVLAGTDAACFEAGGESAQTSCGTRRESETDAELARPLAEKTERAPEISKDPAPGGMTEMTKKEPSLLRISFAPEELDPAAESKRDEAAETKRQEKKQAKETAKRPKTRKKKPTTAKGSGGDEGKPIESLWDERASLNGGEVLPEDGIGFVEKVNEHIDLVRFTELMLRGTDEKSGKSLLGQLLDLRYGKNARLAVMKDDSQDRLTWNLP